MKKLNVNSLAQFVCAAAATFGVAASAWAADANTSVANNSANNASAPTTAAAPKPETPQEVMLKNLQGENFTLAVQKNQNTATVLQWGDLLSLLRPVAAGTTLGASASQVLGVDNGNRQTYLGSLNAGFMQNGLRLQLGLHYHSTFFYDMLTNGVEPKTSTHSTGYAVTAGLAYPVDGVLLSAQLAYFHAKADVVGPETVGVQVDGNVKNTLYSPGKFKLKQNNLRVNLALSKNFPLNFSQVLTPYLAYQMERNGIDATQETLYDIKSQPLTLQFGKQTVTSHSAMAGLMYQVSDAFTTPGLALGLDYAIAYRFGDKPHYKYTAKEVPGAKSLSFKNPDSGVSQRFGFQLGYQWGPVYVGSLVNVYYTFTPDAQPGVLNTQYSLQLHGSF